MFKIRPFKTTAADYQALAEVRNAVWPEYRNTPELVAREDRDRDPDYLFQRFLVEWNDRVVASGVYAETPWSYRPGKFSVGIVVHPDCRRRGIATALYDHLLSTLQEHEPTQLVCSTREDAGGALHFLDKHGFEQVMRFPVSRLELSRFDADPFRDATRRVQECGIEISSLAELIPRFEHWRRRSWELWWEISQDLPVPDPLTRTPYEQFVKRTEHPGFLPEAWFYALDGDTWIGQSNLWRHEPTPQRLYTGLTGVLCDYRRRGIATALKVRGFAFAKQQGIDEIETDNEENNPMFQINLELGFEPRPAELSYRKVL